MPKPPATYDTTMSAQAHGPDYQPLQFSTDPPEPGLVSRIAERLLNTIAQEAHSITYWRKAPALLVTWTDSQGRQRSNRATFRELTDHLTQHRTLNPSVLPLPMELGWLDHEILLSMPFQAPATDASSSLTFELVSQLGANFPLHPAMDREGIVASALQLYLLTRLRTTREQLVTSSNQLFDLDGPWLLTLMAYLNLAVSIVDITLMQIYYKAKYDGPAVNLTFKYQRLGPTRNRRLEDKLRWVFQTTGRPLNADQEVKSLKRIRAVRNHLNHFDPPLLAITIEDAADWLNRTQKIAILLWKIRDQLRVPLPEPLLRLLLAPAVRPVPRDPGKLRPPQAPDAGYASTTWPHAPTEAWRRHLFRYWLSTSWNQLAFQLRRLARRLKL